MHHAYLVKERLDFIDLLEFALDLLNLEKANVEPYFFSDNNFKIGLAREVKEKLQTIVPSEKKRLILLSFITMNDEAQNTLLKALEEPGDNTVFILSTSSPELLLKTVLSRLEEVPVKESQNKFQDKSQSLQILLKTAEQIVGGVKDEKKTKQDALDFIDTLIRNARENKLDKEKMKMLLILRSYILDQSSSLKQILESAILLSYGI